MKTLAALLAAVALLCALCAFAAPAGKKFAGWRGDNGRRYDDGMLVFNLAGPGEVVTLTAVWDDE